MMGLAVLVTIFTVTLAQDPASGWMAYAVGSLPSQYSRVTKLEMTWTVGADAHPSRAFYSPWFGMDPIDNLNLVQPVNPWSGASWSFYTEYFQWRPTHNSNSRSYSVKAGDTLRGSIVYDEGTDSYLLSQKCLETGSVSSQTVKCQSGKHYVLPYIVYEKVFPCRDYPPDGIVTFKNITAECDGVDCTKEIAWEAKVKDANCNMQARIDYPLPGQISITWNTSLASLYDELTYDELEVLNGQSGWGAALVQARRLKGAEHAVHVLPDNGHVRAD